MSVRRKLIVVTTALATSLPGRAVTQDGAWGEPGDALTELIQRVRDGEFRGIHSVLVQKGDTLVVEEYFGGYDAATPHELRSATKVIGSMLVGIAIDQGLLPSENVPFHRFFEGDRAPAYGWTERARAVRIRDFLSMTSGYDCDDLAEPAFACEDAMYEADDWVQYALDLPIVHARGEHWAYNSASLILVGQAIARAAGVSLAAFAERYLLVPIGITTFVWETSPAGHAWVGGGARARPRDVLKIGRLMLQGGLWDGRRLLSREWIEESTRSQAAYHRGVEYGYIWQIGTFFVGGEPIPAFWGSGNGGQYIVVFPDHDLVAVFTGGNYNSVLANQPFEMLDRYILPAVLGTVPPPLVNTAVDELEPLIGAYHLEFTPEVACTVTVVGGALDLATPDGEHVALHAHSSRWFSGDSRYGPVTVVFEVPGGGGPKRLTTYARGSRFVFVQETSRR